MSDSITPNLIYEFLSGARVFARAVRDVIESEKIKTCGKCHSGATHKFVAAITHKPPHPIAHFTEITLIILTVSVFLFICIHVLLDIYADVRDRLFRKGKGGSHE